MFIAIVKRVKDLKDKGHFEGFPPEYPVDTIQLHTASDVDAFLAESPGAEVLTLEQYKGMEKGLRVIFDHARSSKPSFFKRLFGGGK